MAISSLLHAQGAGDDDGLEREALYPGGRTFLLSPVMGFLSYAMTAALSLPTINQTNYLRGHPSRCK
jgi:hypothetical protein